MRMRSAVAQSAIFAGVAALFGVALADCVDLFHSTSDIVTACEADASNPICRRRPASQAPTSVNTNFCAWTPLEARQQAEKACAWLGACAAPSDTSAFGPCMFQALLALDCTSNPNHHVAGKSLALWQCLVAGKTCEDIGKCGFPGSNASIDQAEPPPCDAGDDGGSCADNDAGATCTLSGCVGAALHWCTDDGEGGPPADVGIDCDNGGARACDIFPSRDAGQWAACIAGSAAGSAACAPDASATCSGGIATSCPSGVVETIDCATLLNQGASQGAACTAGPLSPPFDWTSPCNVSPALCTGDSCSDGGAAMTGCARGAAFSVDCAQEGLGPCQILQPEAGGPARAACSPP